MLKFKSSVLLGKHNLVRKSLRVLKLPTHFLIYPQIDGSVIQVSIN